VIAVDVNVLVYLLFEGERTAKSRSLLEEDDHWIAPPLWRSEFRNALVMMMRNGGLDSDEARIAFWHAQSLVDDECAELDSNHILSLAMTSGCTAYDVEYVALAEHNEVPLFTADRQILRAFPAIARPL